MNNKLYVFLSFAICGIGGTQIYVRNKTNYLQKKGWKTCVVSSEPGDTIIIKELESYKNGIFKELANNPFLLSKRKRERIIRNIITYINMFGDISKDEILIESNYIGISPWGEILAERLHAKHFILFIQEDYRFNVDSYQKFFSFKLDRGELAANSHNAIPTLFEGFRDIQDGKTYQLSPFCNNSIEDCESKISQFLPKADYYIGSFGRINKPFVLPMIRDLVEFVKCHPEKTFHLVMFGWTDHPKHSQEIESIIGKITNLTYQITGPIYPVPLCDVKKMDLFISTAGAACSTTFEGILTISYDDVDLKPIGILGKTTSNSLHRDNEPINELKEWMEDIIIKKIYLPQKFNKICAEDRYSKYFDEHMEFLERSKPEKSYYPITRIRPTFLSRLHYSLHKALKAEK